MRWRLLSPAIPLLFLLLLPPPALASEPGEGLTGSHHDFTLDTGPEADFKADVGLCTFCHTPHRSIENRLLWNHTLPADRTYSWSDVTQTIGGTTLPSISPTWTGPSKFCLSCHDGSVAVGDVNWWRGGTPTTPLATTAMHEHKQVGAGGSMNGTHPVGVPYPYDNAVNEYNGTATGSTVVASEFVADPQSSGIRLFNDGGGVVLAGAVAGRTGIECSSCHDPHNKQTEGDYFLRGTLTGSASPYICLKCHTK